NVRLTPIISRQPVNKQLRYGDIDTIIYINFDNEFEKKIEVELYHMASLNNKPRLVDRAEPEWGRWYSYIKNVTNAEDGYYYAVTRYNNGCNPVISDTVRVTVIPNGSTTSVSDLESNSGLLIQPNPSSDFITIQFQPTEGFEPSEGYKVQILDVLGIEVMSVGTGLDLSQQRIDVSHLPAGVYFIRIGDKVEKFVKM
ncbi:MAG: T9SS type A sorting domain-containing protein, partial [Candidatus Kapaibacterium sp.]